MKHGRRHTSLKEKVYRERAAQGAPGYKRPYDAIDVREPDKLGAPPPTEGSVSLGAKISRRTKNALRHVGVDVKEGEDDK